MGCGNANDTKAVDYTEPLIQPTPQFITINIIFQLSSGEKYTINAKEDTLFKTVIDKFKSEHPEINNKTINALFNDNKIDLYKTVSENNIKDNNLIVLDIEEPEIEEDDNISIEYNPENVIWIDEIVDNEENTGYLKDLNSLGYNVQCFKKVDEGFDYIKDIKFESTKIIISGRLYIKFIKKFIDNMNYLYVIPKIIIFTRDKERFLKRNKANEDIINHPFFNYGGIRVIIDDVISFLKDEIVQYRVKKEREDENKNINNNEFLDNRLKNKDDAKLTFEYIDSNQKLTLPLFYKSLIDSIKINDIQQYTELLYSKYSESSGELMKLLKPIKTLYDIPIELLSKYYARIYTIESDFYRDINKHLRENKTVDYLPYIKVLYEGVKLQSLEIASDLELYRGSKISHDEIDKIKGYLDKKKTNLPGAIVFSKSFLSFSKERSIAEGFLNSGNIDNNLSKVLYIVEKDINIDYSLSTHTDIEDISYFNTEKEVLFLPFSPFEIKEIKEVENNEEKVYEIRLLYLGKYLKAIEKDINIIGKENKIPDSEFKKQILELGLIGKDKINNTKQIFINFKQFQENVNNKGFKKFIVKNSPISLYDSYDEEINENKINILTKSYNKYGTFVKNGLSKSQILLKKNKTITYDEGFTIKIIEEGIYKVKVLNIFLPNFLEEYLIPIWFEKDKYIKFNTKGNYRINETSLFHNSSGISSSMKFNYGALIARIGSGEPFVLPSKEYIYFSEVEGPLYLKLKFPNNMSIKPEGKLTIKIYDGELLSREEIYEKIGWKEKELKYANKNSTSVENDLTLLLNNLRMNPILFYESYVKDDIKNKTWTKEFLENMGINNNIKGIRPFSVNNDVYELIRGYIEFKYDNIKKKLTKKNSIEYMKEIKELLEIYIKEKIEGDIIINCKVIRKSEMKHICMQYLYDNNFIENIFDKDYNSIAIHIRSDIIDDYYFIILAITKVDNES